MKSILKNFVAVTVLIGALAFTISSCGNKTENQPPVVTIDEPSASQTFSMSDSIHIEGTATDDESLHEMSVLVVSGTGDTVLEKYPTVHELTTYSFHYHFHPAATGNYTLHVTAEDHDGENTTATRLFMVM